MLYRASQSLGEVSGPILRGRLRPDGAPNYDVTDRTRCTERVQERERERGREGERDKESEREGGDGREGGRGRGREIR
jgi:hypothetical protein